MRMLIQDSSGTLRQVRGGRARVREDRQERHGPALSRVLDEVIQNLSPVKMGTHGFRSEYA